MQDLPRVKELRFAFDNGRHCLEEFRDFLYCGWRGKEGYPDSPFAVSRDPIYFRTGQSRGS